MARRRNRRLLVPGAREALDRLKVEVMQEQAPEENVHTPEEAKFAAADQADVPLNHGYNGELRARQAGKVGGQMGGPMVRRLIEMAQQQLAEQGNQDNAR